MQVTGYFCTSLQLVPLWEHCLSCTVRLSTIFEYSSLEGVFERSQRSRSGCAVVGTHCWALAITYPLRQTMSTSHKVIYKWIICHDPECSCIARLFCSARHDVRRCPLLHSCPPSSPQLPPATTPPLECSSYCDVMSFFTTVWLCKRTDVNQFSAAFTVPM